MTHAVAKPTDHGSPREVRRPMRLLVLVPGAALLAISQGLRWATIDGRQVSQLEAGFGLAWQWAMLLVAAAATAGLLAGRMQLVATTVVSVVGAVLMYTVLAALRATPTIAAVHYGADASAGPALPVSLAGLALLVGASWMLIALSSGGRTQRSPSELAR